MRELLRSTKIYRAMAAGTRGARVSLVIFSDGVYLRPLLRECAKAFFSAEDGTRESGLIEKEAYPDCLFFPAAGAKLTVDDGARIVEESMLRPVEADRRLFVLDNFHAAAPLVQNKLLKILEEPPAGAYFLLGAESEYPVLPTVISRVKSVRESPFSEEKIEAALLRDYACSPKDAREAAAASGGVYSAAERLLSGGGEPFRLAREFLAADDAAAFCRKMGDYKEKRAFFSALSLTLRDMLFMQTGQEKYAALAGTADLKERYAAGTLIKALEAVREAEKQMQFNANFAQCLFAVALAIREDKGLR